MTHSHVNNRVKIVRSERGMTQAQLAEKVQVARVSIVAIETGRFQPTIETALRISKALGTPVDDLFWLKEEKP